VDVLGPLIAFGLPLSVGFTLGFVTRRWWVLAAGGAAGLIGIAAVAANGGFDGGFVAGNDMSATFNALATVFELLLVEAGAIVGVPVGRRVLDSLQESETE
jgi:hypothetical protein